VIPETCGRYIIEREIARGGMGSIWVAWDPQLQRRVVLKRLAPGSIASVALERCQHEAMAAARLSHPNVVHVYDFGIDNGAPYIVMELLDGEDLDSKLRRMGPLPLPAAVDIVQQMARALSAAHAAGLVHRDLKPANIFLVHGDAGEMVKVLDFGIAAMRGDGAAQEQPSARLLGTPAYMSPEQARGRTADHRSDLWSAAVVAYVILTGETPFRSRSSTDLIAAICSDPIPPPSSKNPSLGRHVDAFFERAFTKDPHRRFQSATELASAFAALADASTPQPTKILLIDDEPDMGLLLTQWFQHRIDAGELEFLLAENGEHALSSIRAHPDIDVILSDIRMPGMDGLTFLLAVPDFAPTAKVVMVSAYGDMTNIRLAMNRGAFDFLFKPIDFDDLEATIEKARRQAELARRVVQASEENQLLRLFVHRGSLDRVMSLARGAGAAGSESVIGTAALFDVHNSKHLLRDEAPDLVMSVLNAVLEVAVGEIVAQSGVIERFVGDAALALFLGEDHEARAVRAALAARDAIRARAERMGPGSPYAYGLTVGIESGTLTSGAIGSKSLFRLESVVLGPAIATASQLEQAAKKDEILLGPSVYAALGGRFACRRTEVLAGDDGPIHRVLRAHEHTDGTPLLQPTITITPNGEDDEDD
jgi:serine/threonine protein kinase/class 3 adenylate cyclase